MIMTHTQHRAPGPAGLSRAPGGRPATQEATQARHSFVPAVAQRGGSAGNAVAEAVLLGGFLYAAAGGINSKEMIAIAQVLLRRAGVCGYAGLAGYFASRDALRLGVHRTHPRLIAFESATEAERATHPGMRRSLDCALRVLQGSVPDFARGAWFWEGASLRQGGLRHPRRQAGIRFTQPSHNLYHLPDARRSASLHSPSGETRAQREAQIAFESTAAWGSSIFFRHPSAWLRAKGLQPWKEYA